MSDIIKLTSARRADLMRHDPTGYYAEEIDSAIAIAHLSDPVEITEYLGAHGYDIASLGDPETPYYAQLVRAYHAGIMASRIERLCCMLADALEISRG